MVDKSGFYEPLWQQDDNPKFVNIQPVQISEKAVYSIMEKVVCFDELIRLVHDLVPASHRGLIAIAYNHGTSFVVRTLENKNKYYSNPALALKAFFDEIAKIGS